MAALVAIMIMVSVGTFSWTSIKNLRTHPLSSSVVMLATVIGVVSTHNLAIGVLVGVLLSGIFFAWKIAQIFRVSSALSEDGRRGPISSRVSSFSPPPMISTRPSISRKPLTRS